MTSPLRSRTIPLVLVFSGILTACASRPVVPPDLVARKSTFGTVSIMAEIAIVDDIGEKIDKVDVLENKKTGDMLVAALAAALAKKEYRVGRTAVSSVGDVLDPSATFRVSRSLDDQHQPAGALPVATPPFYLDETLAQHPELAQAWASVIRVVPRYVTPKGTATDRLPNAIPLAKETASDTLLGIVLVGRMIPSGKSIAQGVVTGILTLGFLSTWQTSTVALYGILIDGRDGTVIWAGRQALQARASEPSIHSLVTRLLETLP